MYRLSMRDVTKTFGPYVANESVNLDVSPATIHALFGENGAGKSTLMNVLYGLYRPDAGEIIIDGKKADIRNPRSALDYGIGMVHQHFVLVPTMSVVENILLVFQKTGTFLDRETTIKRIEELNEAFDFQIDPDQPIWKLPIGMQQRVEILKLLILDVDILILDEPTSVLTHPEVRSFLKFIKALRDAGKTIILITHKLEEIFEAADEISVMRQGRMVARHQTAGVNADQLARDMMGRERQSEPLVRVTHEQTPVVLELKDISTYNEKGRHTLRNVSLTLRAGRILGLAGVDGNGQSEIAEVITGLLAPAAGQIVMNGTEEISAKSPIKRRLDYQIAYVPADRAGVGLVMDHTISENLVLRSYFASPFSRLGLLKHPVIHQFANSKITEFDIRLRSARQRAATLSGGNQQKVVLARELEADPRIIVVAQPTKGLDLGSIEFVQRMLIESRNRGAAILYISTELERILEIADEFAVICQGEITGHLRPGEADADQIGLLMSGAQGNQ